MDAVKFCEESRRLCAAYWSKCWGCPAGDGVDCKLSCCYDKGSAEEKVAIVEQWAKEHPAKTRQSEFLRLYPEATVDEEGIPGCPQNVKRTYHPDGGCADTSCYACRREFWMQEVE